MSKAILCAFLVGIGGVGCAATASNDEPNGEPSVSTEEVSAAKRLSKVTQIDMLAAGGDALFMAYAGGNGYRSAVYAVPKAGGAERELAELDGRIVGITAEGDRAFVLTHRDFVDVYEVFVIDTQGAAPMRLASNPAEGWTGTGEPGPIAVHGGTLYWAECGSAWSATGYVRALSLSTEGATPTVIARSRCASSIGFDEAHIYWNDQGAATKRAPLAGGAEEEVLPPTDRFLIDGDWFYWSSFEDNAVYRESLAGGARERLGFYAPTLLGVHRGDLVTAGSGGVGLNRQDSQGQWSSRLLVDAPIRAAVVDGAYVYWETPGARPGTAGVYRRRLTR